MNNNITKVYCSIRTVPKNVEVSHTTLLRYINKMYKRYIYIYLIIRFKPNKN
jgi:hypothetical protein